jgi:hypothetical protein
MPRGVIATAVKLILASLAVGLVLSALDITSGEVFNRVVALTRRAVAIAGDLATWALDYIIVGAAVVVPIWLVLALIRRLRGR